MSWKSGSIQGQVMFEALEAAEPETFFSVALDGEEDFRVSLWVKRDDGSWTGHRQGYGYLGTGIGITSDALVESYLQETWELS